MQTCQYKNEIYNFTCDEPIHTDSSEFCIFHNINYLKGDNYEKNKEEVASRFEDKLSKYQNQAFGIKIRYPCTWRADEKQYYPENDVFTKVVGFISPKEDELSPLKERVAVEVKNLPSQNMSLDDYTTLTINKLKQSITDFQVIELTNTSLAGLVSAQKLTYLDNQGYMVMKVYGILSSKVYIVTFYTESSKFSSYLPIAQKMIDSLEITAATDSHIK